MTTATIDKLALGNTVDSRTRTRDASLDGLKASIAAHGLLQPLVVRPLDETGILEVVAGHRRLRAIQLLNAEGLWPDDKAINVNVVDASDAIASAVSLAENVSRTELHPVEEFEAFARLKADYDMSDEAIARTYGMTELQVRQRLALGALAPAIREAWFAGRLSEKTAMAFTLEPDIERQTKIYDQLSHDGAYIVNDWGVRRALQIDYDHGRLLTFVGRDAFREAGGEFVEDLFGSQPRVLNPEKLIELANARLDAECAKLVEAGWKWALVATQVPDRYSYNAKRVEVEYTKAEETELEKIDKRIAKLDPQDEDGDDLPPAQREEYQRLRARQDEIEEAAQDRAYTPEIKAKSGCFVSIGNDGSLEIERGKVAPRKTKEQTAADKAIATREERKATHANGVEAAIGLTNALAAAVSEQRTVAISRTLAAQPHIALAAACASLNCAPDHTIPVKLRTDGHHSVGGSGGLGLPSWSESFAEYLGHSDAELAAIFAQSIARAVNVVTFNAGAKTPTADFLVRAFPIDLYVGQALEAFDPERYFAGISADGRAAALRLMGSPEKATGKKAEQVALCVSEAKRLGWLPPELAVPAAPASTEA